MLGGAPPDLIVAVLQYLMYYEEDGKRVYTLKVRYSVQLRACSPQLLLPVPWTLAAGPRH